MNQLSTKPGTTKKGIVDESGRDTGEQLSRTSTKLLSRNSVHSKSGVNYFIC